MRFYFETSVLGALTDWPEERRVATTRRLLGAVRDRIHEAVISKVVQEELEQAPGRVREVILREIPSTPRTFVWAILSSRSSRRRRCDP